MSTCSVNINHFINQFNDHICCSLWVLFIVYYLKDFRCHYSEKTTKISWLYSQDWKKYSHACRECELYGINRYIMFTARARQSQMFSFYFLFSYVNIFVISNYGNTKLISAGHSVTLHVSLHWIRIAELNFTEWTTIFLVVSTLRMAAKIETGVFLHQLNPQSYLDIRSWSWT